MIHSKHEYQIALDSLQDEEKMIQRQRSHFMEMGYRGRDLERLMEPYISFFKQLKEELMVYEEQSGKNF